MKPNVVSQERAITNQGRAREGRRKDIDSLPLDKCDEGEGDRSISPTKERELPLQRPPHPISKLGTLSQSKVRDRNARYSTRMYI